MTLSRRQIDRAVQLRKRDKSLRQIGELLGIPHSTIARALQKRDTALQTNERIKARLRVSEEFRNALALSAPRREAPVTSWSVESIRQARDAQMRGDFKLPVKLAAAMRTDDAMFIAYHNRIAPHAAIATELRAAPGARGEPIKNKALSSCIVGRGVLQGICGTLADHGIAIGYIEQETNEDGTRVDFRLTEWPLEHVKYNESTEQLETRIRDGLPTEPIVHGNGRWVVFKKFNVKPWQQEACLLPGALLFAVHAESIKDWAAAANTHGQAKIIGELPEGWSLQDDDSGELTQEAQAFLAMMQDIVSGEVGAGIMPHGAKADFVSNGSTAWQVFTEIVNNREKAAARIYLGTDAILGSVGGAPGVDIAQLFGVATTKIQGDFTCIEQALRTGFFEPWTAINEGDSRYAPTLVYLLPDVDAAKKTAEYDENLTKLLARVKELKEQGMIVDQPVIDRLAKIYNVTPAPVLAPVAGKTPAIVPAPTDFAKAVRVKEVRAAGGLDPIGDPKIDNMFLPQFEAFLKSSGETAGGDAQPAQPTPPPAEPTAAPAPKASEGAT
jgi:hypothetical protein